MAGTALLEVGVMFALLALVGTLAARTELSPIPFYIVAGVAVNETVLGRIGLPSVGAGEFVTVGAELGIVFLLFFLGMEFSFDRLLADGSRIGRAGVADLVINFGAGLVLGVFLFDGLLPVLLVAGIVYISSSAVITKSLLDLGWIANPESAPMLGVLVFEDLVIAVYLAVVTALVIGGGDVVTAARSIGIALAFILLLVLIAARGTSLLERILDTPSSEYRVLRTVGITALLSGAALALGVSEAVAAFFVGTAFGATDDVHELEAALSPLRDVFAGVFFFWIGLVTDPFAILGVLDVIAVLVLVTVPTKLVSGVYGGRVYGLDDRRSLRVGLAMITRGEFSLIVAAVALAGAGTTIPPATARTIYAVAVGYVLVMSTLGTTLMGSAGRLEGILSSRRDRSA
jgi:CPA2 family monovalent cation:H+ antiporter-2